MSVPFRGEALSWCHVGGVVEVELHRAPLNEIGSTTLRELEVLARYVADGAGGARALIVHSGRAGFCAGADLRELHSAIVARRSRRRRRWLPGRVQRRMLRFEVGRFVDRIHAVFDTLDTAPIPTIAAVHGVCFGGGFELALVMDRIVADKTARFCFPELRLGIVPGFGGVPRLERDVGNAVVRDLLLTGRSIGARRAHALGLVSEVVGKGEALRAARRAAEQVSRYDPATVGAAKAFAKPLPRRRLREERALFCRMVTRPEVLRALTDFVEDDGVRPYLARAVGMR
ncbi:MAG: enoyl-CoA hydratase/isomerase family protein [Myxococcales bacterium]|nr:enoyl-CoA hydratase/isomerase family protein [Myxococcales bacterium]